MPKYNLMDNLEPDDIEKSVPPVEKKTAEENDDLELNVDETQLGDFLNEDISVSEPEIKLNGEAIQAEETAANFMPQDLPPVQESAPVMQPFDLNSDYLDEKQPGMNFKPFIYVIGAIVLIALIYFAVDRFILSDSGTTEPEVVQESPEERLQREREEQKQNFLGGLTNSNRHKMSHLAALVDLNPTKLTYSSLLLYGNSLSFEVFAAKRDELGRFNIALKSNSLLKKYNIESSQNRPGSKGGVFALYNLEISPAQGTAIADGTTTSVNPASWSASSASQFGLKIESQRQISTRTENMFSVSRNEFIFTGSESNCNNLIKQLASQNTNMNVHKLNLLPKNQRDMSKAAFELRLTLDFYL